MLDSPLDPHFVIHRTPFRIQHHKFACMSPALFCLFNLFGSQFGYRPHPIDESAIGPCSKDCAYKSWSILIRAG